MIDFTNTDAVVWWSDRLTKLRVSSGIDGFKFDAGEASYLPETFTLFADEHVWPNIYSTK